MFWQTYSCCVWSLTLNTASSHGPGSALRKAHVQDTRGAWTLHFRNKPLHAGTILPGENSSTARKVSRYHIVNINSLI